MSGIEETVPSRDDQPTRVVFDLPEDFMTMSEDEVRAWAEAMYGPLREAFGLPPDSAPEPDDAAAPDAADRPPDEKGWGDLTQEEAWQVARSAAEASMTQIERLPEESVGPPVSVVTGFDPARWDGMNADEKREWVLAAARQLQRSFGIEPNA